MASRTVLKSYFKRGLYPTSAQFAALIDTFFSKSEDSFSIADIPNLSNILAGKASVTLANSAYAMAVEAKNAAIRSGIPFQNQQTFTFNVADLSPNLSKPAKIEFWLVDETLPTYNQNDHTTWVFKPIVVDPSFTVNAALEPITYTVDLGYISKRGFYQIY